MKKTIKYGGLIAGAATAAVATISGAPVFAATNYVDVDSTGCAEKSISVDDSTSDKKVTALKNQAAAYTKLAACETEKAEVLKGDIDAAATAAGNLTAKNSDGTTNYDALVTEKAQPIVNAAKAKYSVTAFDDATLITKINAAQGWTEATTDLDKVGVTDVEILAYIRANNTEDKYGVAEILADFATASAAQAVVDGVSAMNTAIVNAENYTKAAAADEEAIAEILADAKKDAEDTAEAEAEAIEAAEKAIADAEEAGADEATIAKLNAILDAAKKGEDHYDLDSVVAAANKAKADAQTALTKAKNDYSGTNLDTTKDNDVLKAEAEEDIAAYYKLEDVTAEDLSDATFKAAVTDAVYNQAVAKLIAAGEDAEDIDTAAVAAEIKKEAAYYNGIKADVATIAEYYLDALDDQEIIDAIDAYEKAADVAKKVGDVADAIEDVDIAVAAAKAAADSYADVAEAAGETTPSDDDNKGSDDTTSYSYTTLSDSETAYVEGNDLVLHFDAPYADFEYLTIDGVVIDSSMYTVEAGSTKITLSSTLLDTLKEGEHTVIAYYAGDKTATAKFTIASATVDTAKTVKTPDTGVYTAETSGATNSLAGLLGAITAATLAGAVVVLRKRAA